jgi:hypothetical protein
MNEFTRLAGDQILVTGLIILPIYMFYFAIRRVFLILFQEKRNLDIKDIFKILMNAGVIVIMMIILSVSIYFIRQADLSEKQSRYYKGSVLMLFLTPMMHKMTNCKEFV